ncbi:hypothetical protein GCM10025875_11450 [Litorihabitans aurantiacus]|uniref:Aminotransferase class III-fold pyridoxal phosphate-dependent enzyme n=1 Tax=Litorihabitans aurantiacus TaxID=1930061 RepID=A0AA37XDH4_9MICO|nr:hypothetical protein GCM10025875_11450 [Litorihabitans aurantiacus]
MTAIPGPISAGLMRRKRAAVPTAVGTTMPVFAARAGGGVVVDVDGNSLIDLGSGIAVTGVGSSAPRVVAAVTAQVADFTHTCFMVTPYEEYVAVAEKLNALTPGGHEKRTALFSSGAEAVENAIKVARAATGRTAVVAFDHAYHGRTSLTMALTAKVKPYKQGFGPFAPEVYRAPTSYPYRDGLTGPQALAGAIDRITTQVDVEDLAAVIIEPIQGRAVSSSPPTVSSRASRSGAESTASCSSPTRCRRGSRGPGRCSRASTRGSSPTSSSRRRASPAGCRSRP